MKTTDSKPSLYKKGDYVRDTNLRRVGVVVGNNVKIDLYGGPKYRILLKEGKESYMVPEFMLERISKSTYETEGGTSNSVAKTKLKLLALKLKLENETR